MTYGLGRTLRAGALALVAAGTVAGCSSAPASVSAAHAPTASSTSASSHTSHTPAYTAPVTPPAVHASAGPNKPSTTELAVCSAQLAQQLSSLLGEQPTRTQTSTWSAHVYTCHFSYPDGSFSIAVRESSGQAATNAVYAAQQHAAGHTTAQIGLGQQGFTEPNGTVVLRNGFDVVTVAAGTLPAEPGHPPRSRADALHMVAETVLASWQESQA